MDSEKIRAKNLKLVSFNCRSVKRSVDSVRSLCGTSDVVALQETWLWPHELGFLSSVHDDFAATGTSAVDTSAGVVRGRPHGGVAILWRKSVFTSVSIVQCNNVRLCAVKCQVRDRNMLIFSVYMPIDCPENLAEFTDCLSEINAIIDESGISSVIMLGDYNAHPGELFCNEMLQFCEEQKWHCIDMDILSNHSEIYTYTSDIHGCSRWLDHCLVTSMAKNYIENVIILNNVSWSDHYPLEIYCNLNLTRTSVEAEQSSVSKTIWGHRNSEQVERYTKYCNTKLKLVDFPVELAECSHKLCNKFEHKFVIDKLYADTINILQDAAIHCYTPGRQKRKRCVTGWNRHVKPLHAKARLCFQSWVLAGKPTCGATYEVMRESRKSFKNKLKWCQDNEEQIKMDILATSYEAKQFGKFWRHTNGLNSRASLPVEVGGIYGGQNIANMFKAQFKLQPPKIVSKPDVTVRDNVVSGEDPVRFTLSEINTAIKSMKRGKSPGHDGLSIEHLRYAGVHLSRVLKLLYNLCTSHSYLPDAMMRTVVVPIIKNRTGDAADGSNYRPISLATITAKVLDSLLDARLGASFKVQDAQFGFRPELSTESAILCLKQTVRYYTDRKTLVYACFLDLSKAFDLVSYEVLWHKLRWESNLEPELVSLLKYWYGNQSNMVRWGNDFSDPYRLGCGVRQGGLTSPRLFNLYVNQLIERLSRAGVGCSIDGVTVNNISYADDMVLVSPSVSGLRKLLKICEEYAEENGLRYNPKKSELLVFRGNNKPFSFVPKFYLGGASLNQVTEFRYLGHVVTAHLGDDSDLERERRALSVRGNMLARRFARCTKQVKLTLFRAYCQSFYTCSLWANYTQRAYGALRVQYNNVLRAVLRKPRHCSASAMFADARVDDFYAVMRKRAASMMSRLVSSTNTILSTLAYRLDSPFWRAWNTAHVSVRGRR